MSAATELEALPDCADSWPPLEQLAAATSELMRQWVRLRPVGEAAAARRRLIARRISAQLFLLRAHPHCRAVRADIALPESEFLLHKCE